MLTGITQYGACGNHSTPLHLGILNTLPGSRLTSRRSCRSLIIFILLSLIFFLNINATQQCTIFDHFYVPLADKLREHFSYNIHDPSFDTYPMWGYPLLLAALKVLGLNYHQVIYFQYLLFVASFGLLARTDFLKDRHWGIQILMIATFVYYVVVLSMRWPDAIVAFCLFMTAHYHLKGAYLKAALMIGLAYNFRTESLLFLLSYIVIMLAFERKKRLLLALLCLVPYLGVNFYVHHQLIITTTNAGGVLYVSLGQMQGNIWEREHQDMYAARYVQRHTFLALTYPWGIEGNRYLREAFINDITEHPGEYAKKLVSNTTKILKYGYYHGGLEHFHRQYDHTQQTCAPDHVQKISPPLWQRIADNIMRMCSTLSFLLGILYLVCDARRKDAAVYAIIILQVLLCILIQYEPRHLNKVAGIILSLIAMKQAKGAPHVH